MGRVALSGTGFFDNFEAIDTSSEKGALGKEPAKVKKPLGKDPVGITNAEAGKTIVATNHPHVSPPSFNLPTGFTGSIPEVSATSELKQALPPKAAKEVDELESDFRKAIDVNWLQPSGNPAFIQINDARSIAEIATRPPVFCGWAAAAKSGKTGSTVDSLTNDEKAAGAEAHLIDFDTSGETTKSAHHAGSKHIVVLDPWVMDYQRASRIAYDFPATYQKVMDIIKAQIEIADKQNEYFRIHGTMPQPYLKTVIFDGADQWLNICETLMKVEDLGLGVDGISVSGKPHKELLGSGRFNWNIRKVRYYSAITALQELSRRGVHVYLLTHMKKNYDGEGNVIQGGEVPAWLDGTEGKLQQLVIGEIVHERSATGKLTGVSESYATLVENRASLYSSGRVKVFLRDPAGSEWYGWPGLKDGSFSHPDDVKEAEERNPSE